MVYFIVWFISFGSSSRFVTTFIFFFWIDYTRKKTKKKKQFMKPQFDWHVCASDVASSRLNPIYV